MSPDQMTPEQLASAVAEQIRAEMAQPFAVSPHLALIEEALTKAAYYQERDRARGQALLVLSARLDERAEQPAAPTDGEEAPMLPGRPPGGVFVHEPPPPGESAQEQAEAEQAAREAARQAADPDATPDGTIPAPRTRTRKAKAV